MFQKLLIIFCLSSISSGCTLQTLPLQTLYSSNNCAISEPLLKQINSASELDLLLKSFPRNFSMSPVISKPVDFRKQSLILFALGQKTSSGYLVELEKNHAVIKGGKLYLPIKIQQPDKNNFQAQMMTSPCRIYSIPKTNFTEIHMDNI